MTHFRGLLGVGAMMALAWLLSSDRRRFPLKTVVGGLVLQVAMGALVLKTETGRAFFDWLGEIVVVVLKGADAGAKFVFGPLAGDDPAVQWKAVAGIKIMSTIIAVATLSSIGYHYNILQRVVRGMAWVFSRVMGLTGPESLSGAANVFLGQTESPLLIRPYLGKLSESEMMAVMVGGFATISAGVMAYYVSLLGVGPDGVATPERLAVAARHLLTASLMSAPASFVFAKIMIPAPRESRKWHAETADESEFAPIETKNGLDAAAIGAAEGMKLAINVMAMLIAFIALVWVVDAGLVRLGKWSLMAPLVARMGLTELTLDGLLGLAFSPVAFLNGVDGRDCRLVGGLLGKAMATNEMIA
ncbi:MAG TPA: nucleoside transporter C-terminal domain-containing protein, partial [Phycisphaerae bacterium]|nr:nucleoside transporter C-terminal domain-containing protein [Phycisphaerae bacterium]